MRKQSASALIVVDVQVGVIEGSWNSDEVLRNIGKVIEKARASQIDIIWVQQSDEELPAGTQDWQIVPQLTPLEGERIFEKQYNSAFYNTGLEEALIANGVNHVVLVGAATNWCIRATAFTAIDRGYDVTLIGDAHTTQDLDLEDGTSILACDIVKELNIGIKWLSYPDRNNDVLSADDIVFNGLAT